MARIFEGTQETKRAFERSNAQLFFTGGHGGVVTYDGKGGSMVKHGGPIDRVFLIRTDGNLVGDAALDIVYGSIDFATGPLQEDVSVHNDDDGDSCVYFKFSENNDDNAFVIRGGIRELHLNHETVLVHGSVAGSNMVWETGDVTGKHSTLPYVAFHPKVWVNSSLLDWFNLSELKPLAGVAGWCKTCSPTISLADNIATGIPFRTQQHLGHLQVLF